mmetsp:Transcript_68856/g.109232  ORF Transcript_68856/g.109232 Transcript_68856/m.109232 type:complete len:122 (-) Transcript_68856:59-424(-)
MVQTTPFTVLFLLGSVAAFSQLDGECDEFDTDDMSALQTKAETHRLRPATAVSSLPQQGAQADENFVAVSSDMLRSDFLKQILAEAKHEVGRASDAKKTQPVAHNNAATATAIIGTNIAHS